jgi:hypothetical protein
VVRTAVKWVVSLAVGGVFVWLSARDGRFHELHRLGLRVELPYLLGGSVTPHAGAGLEQGSFASLAVEAAARPGWVLDLRYAALYFSLLVVIHLLRVLRWQPLLAPWEKVPLGPLNRIGAVGFMATFLFPLRLGELVRPYLLAREFPHIAMSGSLATIVVERLMDGLVVSLLLAATLFVLPEGMGTGIDLRFAAYSALTIFLGALVMLGLLYWQREFTTRAVRATVGRISEPVATRLCSMLDGFARGLSVLPAVGPLLKFTGLTVVYWLINGAAIWWFAGGCGLDIPLSLAYAMMSCVVVGMMIPNSPGNVGTFWYFLLLPLALYGIGPEVPQATVFGLAVYVLQLVQQTAFGVWYLASGQVKVRSIREAQSTELGSE